MKTLIAITIGILTTQIIHAQGDEPLPAHEAVSQMLELDSTVEKINDAVITITDLMIPVFVLILAIQITWKLIKKFTGTEKDFSGSKENYEFDYDGMDVRKKIYHEQYRDTIEYTEWDDDEGRDYD